MDGPDNAFSLASEAGPLGGGALFPVAPGVEKAISEACMAVADLVSPQRRLNLNQLLHATVCVTLHREGWPERRCVATGPAADGLRGHRAEVVPKPGVLSQTEDCRIFQSTDAAKIIETLRREGGVERFELRLFGDRPAPECAVLVAGQPAARMGDAAAHGGVLAGGAPTVLVGG